MIDLMFLDLFIRWSLKKNYTCHLSMEIRILVHNQEYPKILVKIMEMMF